MSEYLPYEQFEWLKNVDKFDVNSINEKSDIGCIPEVDLEYPKELHELHNDYPLAPEKLVVTNDMLSRYCKEIAGKYDIKVDDVKKLILNLGNKTKLCASLQKSSVVFAFKNETDKNLQSIKI